MGLFENKSPKDWDKKFEDTYYYYCVECEERLRSQGFWYCENPACKRYGLLTVIHKNPPQSLKEKK